MMNVVLHEQLCAAVLTVCLLLVHIDLKLSSAVWTRHIYKSHIHFPRIAGEMII